MPSSSFRFETNSHGEYRIELLPIGHYEVQVEANGFQKYIQKGIVLTLDQVALVNVTIQGEVLTLDYRDIRNNSLLVERFTAGANGGLAYTVENPGILKPAG